MKKILLFLSLFLIFSSLSFFSNAEDRINKKIFCKDKSGKEYTNSFDDTKINKIEIDINDYRKWTVNSVRIITNPFRFTPAKYKKRFDAKISVEFQNNINCSFYGRVRHSGDAKDHISLHDNSVLQSLDIHLNKGNIKGITKFKLYLPGTRGVVEDEIIQTEILRSLNFIAPRTYSVKVRINKSESDMMMQEKAAKELIEFNNRREGPILEGDQKFFFKLVENIPDNQLSNSSVGTPGLRSKSVKTMLTKQSNSKIIHKSDNHKKMSYASLSNLNLIYLYYSNKFQDKKNNFNFFDYDLDNTLLGFFNPELILKLDVYNLLMQATNSQHALSVSNRKFYWNSIENFFEPIYYDSNINIDSSAPTTTSVPFRLPISEHFYMSFDLLEKKLLQLNLQEIRKNIFLAGVNLKETDLSLKINKIIKNINLLEKKYLKLDKELVEYNKFKPVKKILKNFHKTLNEIDPKAFLITHDPNNEQLQRCDAYLKKCENYSFSEKDLQNLLEGEFISDKKIYQYLGKNLDLRSIINHENFNKIEFKKTTIYYDNGIILDNNLDDNLLNITQKNPASRVYIINGEIDNLTINFNSYKFTKEEKDLKDSPENYPIDINGLTGCLTLVNLKVKNISINSDGSSCEDAINIINVKGSINTINVKNSFKDGLDIDFSDVEIENINIFSSGNDCVDVSSGQYKLNYLNLTNCGDKALSVGEKSFLTINEIFAKNSNIGVASKDSSMAKIKNANFKNLETCVSAYNKKQEFYGGFLKITNIACKDYQTKINSDSLSEIIIENEL